MGDRAQSGSATPDRTTATVVTESKSRLVAWLEKHLAASALLTLIAGGTFGVALDKTYDALFGGVSSGPTLEALMNEQKSSFAAMQESLAALKRAAPAADLRDLLARLQREMGSQEEFSKRYQTELRAYVEEVAQLRQQLRAEKGFAGGADFWLGNGESVRLAGGSNVLGLHQAFRTHVEISLNGEAKSMRVGDAVDYSANGKRCKVFYRQFFRPVDRRVGFDVICDGDK